MEVMEGYRKVKLECEKKSENRKKEIKIKKY